MSSELKLDWATFDAAKYACLNWHYSKSLPSAKTVKVGVWEKGKFIGVVIFSMGTQINLVRQYGLTPFEGCELTRVALTKHITPVSRIVSIAIKMLRKQCPKLRLIVSFADPFESHVGGIYQAGGWVYTGITAPNQVHFLKGRKVCSRTVNEWLASGRITREEYKRCKLKVPGKHRYLFVLDKTIEERIMKLSRPYPKKRVASKDNVAGEFHSPESGVNPTAALQI